MKCLIGLIAILLTTAMLHGGFADEPSNLPFPDYRFVTSTPDVQDMWPCFSPDSRTLLFTRTTDGNTWSLFTAALDGGEPKPFPAQSPAFGTRANWSIQHNRIAFNGQPSNGRFNVSVIAGDGTGLQVLEFAGMSDQMTYPSWYPDGKRVAVVDFGGDEESSIKRIDLEKGSVVELTDPKTHWAGVPRVSPDGNTIVMGGQVKQGQRYSQYRNQIFFLNRDGALRPLDSKRGWAPFWSPDGKWIVFASDRGSESGKWAIFVASPDGSIVQQLTPLELNAGHPTWSPDGKWIAFFAQRTPDTKARGLVVVQADAALALARSRSKAGELDEHFRPSAEHASDFGGYRSPLKFYDGRQVTTTEDWSVRRREILDRWHAIMGPWPPLIARPRIEYIKKERREDFTQHTVQVEIASNLMCPAILLVPDGDGPFPAAVVPYYEAETGAGLGKELRDFGYQLTKRGFVTLSIGGFEPRRDREDEATIQRLSFQAYGTANCHTILASLPNVDRQRIGIVGHSFGGKWAMFASCLYEKFACAAWSDGGVVFDESRANVNYWEPWYLGYDTGRAQRQPGIPNANNPRTGAYLRLVESGLDLHELHALMAPRPFLVSGGAEDRPDRWKALNHAVAVNKLLGYEQRVAMTNRPGHTPTPESNEQIYQFFERFLRHR